MIYKTAKVFSKNLKPLWKISIKAWGSTNISLDPSHIFKNNIASN